MYYEIRRRIVQDVSPFHQKMLRLGYDVPLVTLRLALARIFEYYDVQKLCLAQDIYELSAQTTDRLEVMTAGDFMGRLCDFAQEDPLFKTGIFPRRGDGPDFSFYLRLYIEDPGQISRGEIQGGNLELYAPEDDLRPVCKALREVLSAFVLTEGAKKYLEEISWM